MCASTILHRGHFVEAPSIMALISCQCLENFGAVTVEVDCCKTISETVVQQKAQRCLVVEDISKVKAST
jgi:hypothetical protein